MRVWVDAPPRPNAEEAFAHPALFYQGPWEYLSETVPFIREGLAADEPVAVAVPGPRLELLREALGDLAGGVRLVDMSVGGPQPGPDHRRGAARGRRRPPGQARARHR